MIGDSKTILLPALFARLETLQRHCIIAYADFASDLMKTAKLGASWTFVARFDGERYSLRRADEHAETILGAVGATASESDHLLVSEIFNAHGQPARVVLRLAGKLGLLRTVTLPTNTPAHIGAILRNKIDRLGPWPAELASFGYRIAAWSPADKQARIEVAITSRENLAVLMQSLEGSGIHADQIELETGEDGQSPIVLGKTPTAGERAFGRKLLAGYAMLNGALAAVLTAALAFNLAASERLAVTEGRFDQRMLAEFRAGDAGGGSPELDAARTLFARKKNETPALILLRDITHALPDTVWLHSLNMAGNSVTLSGTAQNAPALIVSLQAVHALKDVAFSAPIIQSDDGHSSDFSISASLTTGTSEP